MSNLFQEKESVISQSVIQNNQQAKTNVNQAKSEVPEQKQKKNDKEEQKVNLTEVLEPYINESGQFFPKSLQFFHTQKLNLDKPVVATSFAENLQFEGKFLGNIVDDTDALLQKKKILDGKNEIFICECGDKFDNYHTLYNHQRNKCKLNNQQNEEQQQQKQEAPKNTGRGRPKKHLYKKENDVSKNVEQSLKEQVTKLWEKSTLAKNRAEILKQLVFKEDLTNLFRYCQDQQMKIEGSCNPFDGLPTQKQINPSAKPILNPVLAYIQKIEEQDLKLSEIGSQTTCDQIFSIFLLNLSRILQLRAYRVVCIIFKALRECMNKHMYKLMKQQNQNFFFNIDNRGLELNNNQKQKKLQYCEIESAGFLFVAKQNRLNKIKNRVHVNISK
ncbi:hypothetical protein PPERSA_06738 [Pseudocohnilembus persalinus]|uniref:Uncharacterized protein n=1 Tax=Pseudocohnilembus persalinus TaxID=266149 RepID=A0A0V0QSZ7_PSEPJ|nr:hypothetical protein PPERSA_06738 [Pseudocohnilembus persalinus]|eukprot:KRX05104.1 hypothetical protein PPERSA_06738 [Pseudocohnilembus persalinus]